MPVRIAEILFEDGDKPMNPNPGAAAPPQPGTTTGTIQASPPGQQAPQQSMSGDTWQPVYTHPDGSIRSYAPGPPQEPRSPYPEAPPERAATSRILGPDDS